MLSIITCTVDPVLLNQLACSIRSTINIPYELIAFDNSVSKLSITKAYNQSASKAKFEYLAFVHEDVEFLEKGWAERLLSILQDTKIGVVGVAGSTYLPSVPSSWYLPDERYNCVFIKQGFKYKEAPVRFDNQGDDLTPVYLLDGVFLAMRKQVFDDFKFDENIEGFHIYDIDLCQRISKSYSNLFTKQILLIHHSEGKVDKSYFDALIKYKSFFLNYNYKIIDKDLEFRILKSLYMQLRVYYSVSECKDKLKLYAKVKSIGWIKYLNFNKLFNL